MKKFTITLIATLALLTTMNLTYAVNWQQITTITGSTDQTTNYFAIPTKEWRIEWIITPASDAAEYAVFGAFIYPKGETNQYVDHITKFAGSSQNSGITYIHEGAKDYYLTITVANVQAYTLRIEYDAGTSEGTTAASSDNSTGTLLSIAIGLAFTLAATSAIIYIAKRQRKKRAPS